MASHRILLVCLVASVTPARCGFFDFLTNLLHPAANASSASNSSKAEKHAEAAEGASKAGRHAEKAADESKHASDHPHHALNGSANMSSHLASAEDAARTLTKVVTAGCDVGNLTGSNATAAKKLRGSACKANTTEHKDTNDTEAKTVKPAEKATTEAKKETGKRMKKFGETGPVMRVDGASGRPLAAGATLLMLVAVAASLALATRRNHRQVALPTENEHFVAGEAVE